MTGDEHVCLFHVKLIQVTRNDCLGSVVSATIVVFGLSHLQFNPINITSSSMIDQYILSNIVNGK